MRLKHLDLVGFKSFPDRTRLSFGPGMTAVVGPNGSGKSNIADALRWVMGETSAKTLRGGKMEDVIFAGTAHRRPLGYAEIVMQLENADRQLPMETDEVAVTRRVYRSGESEYLLNGAACRLKDIQQLFMDTGVGRDGYSIIGQGRIDEILSARSEDRRLLFEEAAGIGKFKARRNEALQKMERERQNLARADDILTELAEQLAPLETQAEEARRYLSLRERYKTVHITVFLEEAVRLQDEIDKNKLVLAELAAQAAGGQRLLTEARAAGETLKASAVVAAARAKRANETLMDDMTAQEKRESHIALLASQLRHTRENRVRFEEERRKRDAGLAEKDAQLARTRAAREENAQALRAAEARLDERQEEHAALDAAMRGAEEALAAHDETVMVCMARAAEAKTAARETELAYEGLENDKERLNSEILHNETTLAAEEARHRDCAAQAQASEAEAAALEKRLAAYRDAQAQLKTACETLSADYHKQYAAYQTCASRYQALRQLEAHHEGYYRSVKAVLNAKTLTGICGAVGSLVDVPAEYETAIETALGGAAQHIAVETEDDAKRAIDMLKATREGRATFLPLTAIRGRDAKDRKPQREPGFIGMADALVGFDARYAGVMSQLLGNVVVMDGIDAALALQKKYSYAYKIVTLTGELLSPGGAITGGGAHKNASGLLGRGRQLNELAAQEQALRQAVDKLAAERAAETEKLQATEEALTRASAQRQDLLLRQNTLRHSLDQAAERVQALQAAAAERQRENEGLMARLVAVNAQLREATRVCARREDEVQAAREQTEAYRARMADERAAQSGQMAELSDLRVAIGRLTETLAQTAEALQRLQKEKDVLAAEKAVWQNEIAASKETEAALTEESEAAQDALAQGRLGLDGQRAAIADMEQEKADLDAAIGQAEADERAQTDEATRLETALARLETRGEQWETDSRRLYEEVWEEYGLTYQQAQPYKDPALTGAALRAESQRLKAELTALAKTNVNVGAVEMYKQVKTRHDFLAAQKEDILRAEADLRELADGLTRQMEAQFADQFEKISVQFNEVFREMFNGGQAGLKLLDGNNILESGIEISAQPPGKSLQTLLLLSGGERALTATALLFAILRLKPSPFCVLDEIEAALDDANVTRFASFLQQYTDGTQFIIITHRKGTMEAADTLYGVTMQEQGVSKLVSVRFV